MARRKRRYGEVHLKRRGGKISRMVYQHSLPSRKAMIKVFVSRYMGDRLGYQAWACPASSSEKASRAASGSHSFMRAGERCGPYGSGRTPTCAIESALAALARSHALRKGGR